MGLLDGKSFVAQDLYNEYLRLKVDIRHLIDSRKHFLRHNKPKEVAEFEADISHKVERFKCVLNQLEIEHGVSMKDLILLSVGIDLED